MGQSWIWLTQDKLLAGSHRNHPCSPPTTKAWTHKPTTSSETRIIPLQSPNPTPSKSEHLSQTLSSRSIVIHFLIWHSTPQRSVLLLKVFFFYSLFLCLYNRRLAASLCFQSQYKSIDLEWLLLTSKYTRRERPLKNNEKYYKGNRTQTMKLEATSNIAVPKCINNLLLNATFLNNSLGCINFL